MGRFLRRLCGLQLQPAALKGVDALAALDAALELDPLHVQKSEKAREIKDAWEEHLDPSRGMKYWWNRITHQSTWVHPDAAADDAVIQQQLRRIEQCRPAHLAHGAAAMTAARREQGGKEASRQGFSPCARTVCKNCRGFDHYAKSCLEPPRVWNAWKVGDHVQAFIGQTGPFNAVVAKVHVLFSRDQEGEYTLDWESGNRNDRRQKGRYILPKQTGSASVSMIQSDGASANFDVEASSTADLPSTADLEASSTAAAEVAVKQEPAAAATPALPHPPAVAIPIAADFTAAELKAERPWGEGGTTRRPNGVEPLRHRHEPEPYSLLFNKLPKSRPVYPDRICEIYSDRELRALVKHNGLREGDHSKIAKAKAVAAFFNSGQTGLNGPASVGWGAAGGGEEEQGFPEEEDAPDAAADEGRSEGGLSANGDSVRSTSPQSSPTAAATAAAADEGESGGEEDQEYVVESIVDCRAAAGSTMEYLVKWSGYMDTTWEPPAHLTGNSVFAAYKRQVDEDEGADDDEEDYDAAEEEDEDIDVAGNIAMAEDGARKKRQLRCKKCGAIGHMQKTCGRPLPRAVPVDLQRRCGNCGVPGHTRQFCQFLPASAMQRAANLTAAAADLVAPMPAARNPTPWTTQQVDLGPAAAEGRLMSLR